MSLSPLMSPMPSLVRVGEGRGRAPRRRPRVLYHSGSSRGCWSSGMVRRRAGGTEVAVAPTPVDDVVPALAEGRRPGLWWRCHQEVQGGAPPGLHCGSCGPSSDGEDVGRLGSRVEPDDSCPGSIASGSRSPRPCTMNVVVPVQAQGGHGRARPTSRWRACGSRLRTTMTSVVGAVVGRTSRLENTSRWSSVGVVEAQVAQPLQGGVLAPDLVQPADVRRDRLRLPPAAGLVRRPVAGPVLVLLGVEVLLAARPQRDVLAQLEPGVHAPGRRQHGGEHRTHLERRRPAVLQVGVRMSWRVDEEVRPQVRRRRSWPSSVRYSSSSALVLRQVK